MGTIAGQGGAETGTGCCTGTGVSAVTCSLSRTLRRRYCSRASHNRRVAVALLTSPELGA
eukprot:6194577-Pleurochrysis_carterae.AAC.1